MTPSISVFVNDRMVSVPADATAIGAVRLLDPGLAGRIGEGSAYLTDARGLRIEPDAAVYPGAIIRVVQSARVSRDQAAP